MYIAIGIGLAIAAGIGFYFLTLNGDSPPANGTPGGSESAPERKPK